MKSVKKLILSGILILLFSLNGKANHLMGGEITWTCVGKDSFMVKLVVYRDCNYNPLSATYVGIKCATNGQNISTLTISVPAPVDLTPVCGSSCTRCQSSSCSFPYGIQQYLFIKMVYLAGAGSCCEVLFSYSDCCRTNTITTGAAGENIYIEAKLNRCLTPCDNSPSFTVPPISVICVGQDYQFNNGVIDVDVDSNGGLIDSISYEWTVPLKAQGTAIPYSGSYTYDKPIYFWGFPTSTYPFPRGIQLDQSTGDISFRPMKVEQTVMALKVSEWRKLNGKMTRIGVVRRDIQIIVISCPNNHAPVLGGSFYKEICAGDTVSLTITTNDYDTQDSLKLSLINNNYGATLSVNTGVKHPTGKFTWIPNINQGGSNPYLFYLNVKDDNCPTNGSSTRGIEIKVIPKAEIKSVKDTVINCLHYLTANTNPPQLKVNWTFGSKVFSGNQIVFKPDSIGDYPFFATIPNYCSPVFYDTIKQDSFLFLSKLYDIEGCRGITGTILPTVKYNRGKIIYKWSTGDSNSSINYNTNTTLKISLVVKDSIGCVSSDSFKITAHINPDVNIGKDIKICENELDTIKSTVTDCDGCTGYFYNTNSGVKVNNDYKEYAVSSGGTYTCLVSTNFGCKDWDTIEVFEYPQITPFSYYINACPHEKVTIGFDSTNFLSNNYVYSWQNQPDNHLVSNYASFKTDCVSSKKYLLSIFDTTSKKTCSASGFITLKLKFTEVKLNGIQEFCKYDSLVDMRLFVDPSMGSISSNHPSVSKGYLYNPFKSSLNPDSVWVQLKDTKSQCVWDTIYTPVLFEIPAINIGTQYNKKVFCPQYKMVKLNASPTGGIYGGKWIGPVEPGNYFNANRANGDYKLIYEFRSDEGCYNMDSLIISIENPSISIIKDDTALCSGKDFQAIANFSISDKMQWAKGSSSDGYFSESLFNPTNIFSPGFNDKKNHGFWLYAKTIDPVCPEVTDSIHVYIGAIPKAAFSTDLITGLLPLKVQFTDQTSIDYDQLADHSWNFGDGNTSKTTNPLHSYNDSGYHDVNLKVTSNIGCSDSLTKKKLIYVYTVSIPENNIGQIQVYPNPATDQIIIESTDNELNLGRVVLTNVFGVKIREIPAKGKKSLIIERGDLPAGTYFLKVYDTSGDVHIFQLVFE